MWSAPGCDRTWCWIRSRPFRIERLQKVQHAEVVVEGVEVLLPGLGEQTHQLAVDLVQLLAAALEVHPARALGLAVVPARSGDGERLVPGLEVGALLADRLDEEPLDLAQPLRRRQTVKDRDQGVDAIAVLLHRPSFSTL